MLNRGNIGQIQVQIHISIRNIILIIIKLTNDIDGCHCHYTTKFQEDISTLRGEKRSLKSERFSATYIVIRQALRDGG